MTIKDNVKKLESIARAVRRASISQHFVPIFAVCNSLKEQEEYVEKLRRKCNREGIVLTEVKLLERPPITRLLHAVKEHLVNTFKDGLPERLGIQITGLELSILLDEDEQAPAVLQILNMNRESYYKDFSFPFIFWLPEYAIIKVANAAPDFWSIQVGSATFSADDTPGTPLPESIGSGKSLTVWQDKQSQIPVLERLLNSHPSPEVRVELLIKSADAYYYIGKTDKAQQRYEQAIKVNQEHNGDPQQVAEAHNKLGLIYSDLGTNKENLEKAEKSLRKYLEIVEQGDRTERVTMAHNHLGLVYDKHKEYHQALQAYQEAREISRRHGHRKLEGDVLGNMGLLFRKQNKYKDALKMHEQALGISREMNDIQGEALDLSNIGLIYHEQNQYEKAIDYYNQALLKNRHLGNKLEEINQLIHLGDAWKALGDFSKSLEKYNSAKTIAENININIFTIWDRLAALFGPGALDDPKQKILLLKEAIEKSHKLENADKELQYWESLCEIHREQNEITGKNNCLMQMEAIINKQIQQSEDEYTIIRCHEKLEKIYKELGKKKKLEACRKELKELSYRQIVFWVEPGAAEIGDKEGQSILEVGKTYNLNFQVVRKPPKYSLIFKTKIPSFSDKEKTSNIVEQPVIESRRISEEKKRSNIPIKESGEPPGISRKKNAASKVEIGDRLKDTVAQPTLLSESQEYYIPSGQQEKINKIKAPAPPMYMPDTSTTTVLFHFKSPGISFERSKIDVLLSENNMSDVKSLTITPKSPGDYNISVKVRVEKFEYENDFIFPLRVVWLLPSEKRKMADRSHVRIIASKKPEPEVSLLMVDKEIAKQWNMWEKDILVYSSIPLARITFEELVGSRDTILGLPMKEARWCIPADFFTEKLVLIKQKNAFPGTIKIKGSENLFFRGGAVTPVIPLTGFIIDYLDPYDLADRVRFEQLEDEFIVYLYLPLTGPDSIGKGFVISRSYSFKKGDIIVQMAVPILEIWPDFILPNWKIYYSYFSTSGRENVIYASPFKQVDEKWDNREVKNKSGNIEREIIQMDHFPEAFECRTYLLETNKRLIAIEVGILLLERPEEIKPLGKTFNIAVDFGTSRTNVYFQEGEFLPQRFVFNEHFFEISAVPALQRLEMYDYFFPPYKVEMPIKSIFHDFLNKAKDLQPILDGHIYFPYVPKELYAGDDRKKIEMKWGKPEERDRARTFMEQLCLMCVVEAARRGAEKINWRFAVPTAFSQSDEETIKLNWRIISDKILKLTGLKVDVRNLHFDSEGVAFVSYFANSPDIKAAIPRGAVFIDIRGTSSDISIWGGGNLELLVQTFLRFAGRNMFSYPLWVKTRRTNKKKENNVLISLFKKEDIDALYRDEVRHNPIAFYNQLDAIVSIENQNILQKLPNLSQEIEINEFKQFLAIGIAGMLYYIGLLVRGIPDREKVILTAPNIYFGGNDARLLHWLAGGKFDQDNAINFLLKGVFRKAAGITDHHNFEIEVSPAPGEEVAYGLVLDQTPLKYDVDMIREGYFLAGETFTDLDNKQYKWNQRLTPTIISKGIKLLSENGNFKMEMLEDFIKTFNENVDMAAIPRIAENPRILQEIGDHVNHEFARLRDTKEWEIQIEPLFILALKKLLDEMIDEW
ncbi:MAG: tetratricopeptide repeat protein [Candidatus Aminicenantes bacterium]